jgi:hypothetical protein
MLFLFLIYRRGCHGRERMVVGFTTTCAIGAYQELHRFHNYMLLILELYLVNRNLKIGIFRQIRFGLVYGV